MIDEVAPAIHAALQTFTEFEKEFLDVCESKNKVQLDALKAGKFDDSITSVLEATAKELAAKYN